MLPINSRSKGKTKGQEGGIVTLALANFFFFYVTCFLADKVNMVIGQSSAGVTLAPE